MSQQDSPPDAPPFHWDDRFVLGFGPMDAVHEEFVGCIAALLAADDAALAPRLEELAGHLQQHFGMEDQWMRETAFPPRDCHIDEHAAVLNSVQEVRALLAEPASRERGCAAARGLAAALQDWFPGHADYLDSALAAWMCRRQLGGKPVVLRRNIQRTTLT